MASPLIPSEEVDVDDDNASYFHDDTGHMEMLVESTMLLPSFFRGWTHQTILWTLVVLAGFYAFTISILWTATRLLTFQVGRQLLVFSDMGLIAGFLYRGWNEWVLDDLTTLWRTYKIGFSYLLSLHAAIATSTSESAETRRVLLQRGKVIGAGWLPLFKRHARVEAEYSRAVADMDAALHALLRVHVDDAAIKARVLDVWRLFTETGAAVRASTRARIVDHTQIWLFMLLYFFVLLPLSIWLHTDNFTMSVLLTPLLIFVFLFRGIFRYVTGSPFYRANSDAHAYWGSPYVMQLYLERVYTRF